MDITMKRIKDRLALLALVVTIPLSVAAQNDWSGWEAPQGGGTAVEYRWRVTACLPVGCFKDVQFRNNNGKSIHFTYTVWSEGTQDKGDEAADTGSASIAAQATEKIQASRGGPKVTRVSVELKQ
jgi:hypothetical protein